VDQNSASNDPTDIFMWRRIDHRLTTSGQPTGEQLAAIKALRATHIINLGLHTHEKAIPDEAGSVDALGMEYIHIPVDFDNPTEADYQRFRTTMNQLDGQTVHVHCIANLRVSAFLHRYRCEELGVTKQDARAQMESIWRPGGAWAKFVGDEAAITLPHRFAGRDYDPSNSSC
jgi:protein tyrosine phosphatase (PTP) superfamily phosphohydrolase (DUF442 family)